MGGNPTRSFSIYLELLISLSYYLGDDMKLSESSEIKRELTVPCALIVWSAFCSVFSDMIHANQDRPLPVTFSEVATLFYRGMAGDSEL